MSPLLEWIIYWLVSGAALYVTAALVPGFRIQGFGTAVLASLIISAVNWVLRPILIVLSLPLTVLTLGFFLFVIDAIILRICAGMMEKFEISNWFSAVMGAIILAMTSGILHFIFI